MLNTDWSIPALVPSLVLCFRHIFSVNLLSRTCVYLYTLPCLSCFCRRLLTLFIWSLCLFCVSLYQNLSFLCLCLTVSDHAFVCVLPTQLFLAKTLFKVFSICTCVPNLNFSAFITCSLLHALTFSIEQKEKGKKWHIFNFLNNFFTLQKYTLYISLQR